MGLNWQLMVCERFFQAKLPDDLSQATHNRAVTMSRWRTGGSERKVRLQHFCAGQIQYCKFFKTQIIVFKSLSRWGSKVRAMQDLAWVPKLLLGEESFWPFSYLRQIFLDRFPIQGFDYPDQLFLKFGCASVQVCRPISNHCDQHSVTGFL